MLNNLLAEMSAGTITDIIIAVIFLIIAIISCAKGFVKQTFGFITTVCAILIAYFLCDDLVNLVNKNFDWNTKLAAKLADSFSGNAAFSLELTTENLSEAIHQMGLPSFIADFALKILPEAVGEYENVGLFLSAILANYILIAAAFAFLFILSKIILGLLKKLVLKVVQLPLIRSVDKLLGLAFGVIKAALWIIAIVYVIKILPSSIPYISYVKDGIEGSQIIQFIDKSNLSGWIFGIIDNLISSIIG